MTTDGNGSGELFTAMRNDVARLLRQELAQLTARLALGEARRAREELPISDEP